MHFFFIWKKKRNIATTMKIFIWIFFFCFVDTMLLTNMIYYAKMVATIMKTELRCSNIWNNNVAQQYKTILIIRISTFGTQSQFESISTFNQNFMVLQRMTIMMMMLMVNNNFTISSLFQFNNKNLIKIKKCFYYQYQQIHLPFNVKENKAKQNKTKQNKTFFCQ